MEKSISREEIYEEAWKLYSYKFPCNASYPIKTRIEGAIKKVEELRKKIDGIEFDADNDKVGKEEKRNAIFNAVLHCRKSSHDVEHARCGEYLFVAQARKNGRKGKRILVVFGKPNHVDSHSYSMGSKEDREISFYLP